MIFYLLSFSLSVVLGMDLGSEKIRVAALRSPTQMSILLDNSSNRYFRSTFTVVPNEKGPIKLIDAINFGNNVYYFDNQQMEKKFPQHTTRYYNDFVGKILTDEMKDIAKQRKIESEFVPTSNMRFTTNGIYPEYLLYRTFNIINSTARALEPPLIAKTAYIAVPKFMMQQERKSVRIAAKLANYTSRIIDSSMALGYNFAFTHDKKFSKLQKPLTVAFVDIGDLNTQVTVTQFSGKRNITISEIFYNYSQTIGGRLLDVAIYKLLKSRISYPPSKTDKQLLLAEANRIKHRLTTNVNAVGQVDGSETFYYNITRSEFENSIKNILDELYSLLSNIPRVDRVQLIGGSSRVLCIQEIIKKALKQKELSVSMNPEESISYGAALYGAVQSSEFKTFNTIQYNPYQLYNFQYYDALQRRTTPNVTGTQTYLMEVGPRYPTGSSGVAAWGTIHNTTIFKQTKDGLYRIKQNNRRVYDIWEIKFIEQLKLFDNYEFDQRLISEEANSLEGIILDLKSMTRQLDYISLVCSQEELNRIIVAVNATDRWFLKQKSFILSSLQQRKNLLLDAVGGVMSRIQYFTKLNGTIDYMNQVLESIEHGIRNIPLNKRMKHVKRADIRNVIRMMAEIKLWLKERQDIQKRLGPMDNPALKWYELQKLVNEVADLYKEAIKIKAPSPDDPIYISGDIKYEL